MFPISAMTYEKLSNTTQRSQAVYAIKCISWHGTTNKVCVYMCCASAWLFVSCCCYIFLAVFLYFLAVCSCVRYNKCFFLFYLNASLTHSLMFLLLENWFWFCLLLFRNERTNALHCIMYVCKLAFFSMLLLFMLLHSSIG